MRASGEDDLLGPIRALPASQAGCPLVRKDKRSPWQYARGSAFCVFRIARCRYLASTRDRGYSVSTVTARMMRPGSSELAVSNEVSRMLIRARPLAESDGSTGTVRLSITAVRP